MPSASVRPVYASNGCEIDTARRELRVRGFPVPIGGRAFEMIEVLAQSAGELVTKDELMSRVWPGAIVMENTLQVHASAVRKALGPYRDLLKTESRRGYRLLGTWTLRRSVVARPPVGLRQIQTSQAPHASNLPAPRTRLIGRSVAAGKLHDLISAYRVVTLTGPGGIGKSSLALKVARRARAGLDGGGWLVEMASLSDPHLAPSAVARVLELKLGGERISPDMVARAIGGQELLLVLDNCEHLIEAAAALTDTIVRLCPRVSILVTSREALGIEGEYVYGVPPLEVPTPGPHEPDYILGHSAVQLFIDRATAQRSDLSARDMNLSAISTICRRLDGIPLAIEFAATSAATLGLDWVAASLDDRFGLLTVGRRTALPRHQTLRAALDWSYELLPEPERHLLRRLAVFPAGFTLEAVTAVMRDSGQDVAAVTTSLVALVAKSLVATDGSQPSGRWRLLETIRAYGIEKLREQGEFDTAARNHAAYFRDLFALSGLGSAALLTDDEWTQRVREIDNVRAALDWSFSPWGEDALGIDLTAAYAPVWLSLLLMGECRARCERALRDFEPTSMADGRLQLWLRTVLGRALIDTMGAAEQARSIMTGVLATAESLHDVEAQAQALTVLCQVSHFRGEYAAALGIADRLERIAARVDEPMIARAAYRHKGITLLNGGRPREAERYLERSLQSHRLVGNPGRSIWFTSDHAAPNRALLARALWLRGFTLRALEEAQIAIEEFQPTDYPLVLCLTLFFGVCRFAPLIGDFATAEQSIARVIDIATGLNVPFWKTVGRLLEGKLMVERREFSQAFALLRDAFDTCLRTGWRISHPEFRAVLAQAYLGLGRVDQALEAVDEGLTRAAEQGDRWYVAELLRMKGEVLLEKGSDAAAAAEHWFLEALTVARNQEALFWELRIALSLARLWATDQRHGEARQLLAPLLDRFIDGFETTDLRTARALLARL